MSAKSTRSSAKPVSEPVSEPVTEPVETTQPIPPEEEDVDEDEVDEDEVDESPVEEIPDLHSPGLAKQNLLIEIDELDILLAKSSIVSRADSRDLFRRILDLIRQTAGLS